MNGIEKITQRIDADTRTEIDAVLAEAEQKASAVRAGYEAQAAELKKTGENRNRELAEKHHERLVSAAQMESRQQLLATKQACIDETFAKALTQLTSLPAEQYAEILAKWVAGASETGKEALILSKKNRDAIGEMVTARANALRAGAAFTLSDETRETEGVILQSGSVEINGSLGTRFQTLRESMASEIAELLFS